MQDPTSSSLDAGNLCPPHSPLGPGAVRRFLFYLVLAAAIGLAALEIELSNNLEEAAQSETQP